MYLLGMKYLEALPTLAQGKNATIFLPAEATGVMGAIGGLERARFEGCTSSLSSQSDAPTRLGSTSRRRQRSERFAVVSSKPISLARAERVAGHTRARTVASTASRN